VYKKKPLNVENVRGVPFKIMIYYSITLPKGIKKYFKKSSKNIWWVINFNYFYITNILKP
jgi:hypothetical protein